MGKSARTFLVVIAALLLLFSSLLLSSLEFTHLCHFEQWAENPSDADTRFKEPAKNAAPFHKHHACYLPGSLTFAVSTFDSLAPISESGDSLVWADVPTQGAFSLFIHFRAPPVRV